MPFFLFQFLNVSYFFVHEYNTSSKLSLFNISKIARKINMSDYTVIVIILYALCLTCI